MTASCNGGAPYDIVFAGAGLAGLSLAARLAALPNPPRMLLVDPRQDETSDRTWCHWQLHKGIFDDAITHRWHHWTVGKAHDTATVGSADIPYVRIPSDRFRRIASAKIAACPHAEILLGVSVTSIEEFSDRTVVHLSNGRRIEGKDVEEADAFGSGGLEIHEGHGAGIEVGFGGMEFESAENLAPWGAVVLRRAAVEDP